MKIFNTISSLIFIIFISISITWAQCGNLYIAGVIDGPLSGGQPKGIQVCASADIADLSIFGLDVPNNGTNPFDPASPEYAGFTGSLQLGECIWIADSEADLNTFFGNEVAGCTIFETGAAGINGDDPIALVCGGAVVDVFGEENMDGSGLCWEHTDGWAYNNNTTQNGGAFNCTDWTFSGIDALEGESDNGTAANPYPNTAGNCPAATFDCPAIMANIGDTCTDSDGDASTIDANCMCIETDPPPPADIYISELSFNPCGEQGTDGDCEYIVITNNGANAADLSNYSIGGGFTYTFPSGTTIPAGGNISLGISAMCPAGTFDLSGGWNGGLSNSSNETIEILDAGGTLVSSVTYDGSIGDGDCMANCFDAGGVVSACASSVLGTPTFDCPDIMANVGDTCTDSDGDASTIDSNCMCIEVTPTFDCPAIMANIGDACDDGDASTNNDMVNAACLCEGTSVMANCPASAKINEFHYDNASTDMNEFVEIALPTGSDPSQVQIDLINDGGSSYNNYVLSAADLGGSDGTFDYYVWYPSSIQNGDADGIAVSCLDGTLYQFLSYEGIITGVEAPVEGATSTDVGVIEDSNTTETQSIMCDGSGNFLANCTADPGAVNDLTTCVTEVMGCIDQTACNYDENANVDDGSCLFATGCDVCDGMGGIIDNPEVGDLCDDGDPVTNYDIIQVDCTCAGTVEMFDCPALQANVGDQCDDGSPGTENDVITDDCVCAGIGVCLANFMVGEITCDEIPGAPETYTVNIDFTGGGFDMFTIEPNAGEISGLSCRCEGVVPPPPGDLFISELSYNPCGTQGDDGDCEYFVLTNNGANTIDLSGYTISNAFSFTFPDGTTIAAGQNLAVGTSENCPNANFDITGGWSGSMGNSNAEVLFLSDSTATLVGVFTYDISIANGDCMAQCLDNAGTPSSCIPSVFAEPDCPDLMLSIGDACDDMDASTGNDTVLANCTCVGTTYDCPDLSAFFGDACDDGDVTTLNDIVQADCTCAGMEPPPPGDIVIIELSFNPCAAQGDDGDCEYILIQNNGTMDYDLTGWAIANAFDYSFPDGTIISAGQTLSIGRSANCNVANFDLAGGWDGSLGNANNETIIILDDTGAIESTYTYDANIADGDCMAQCFDVDANPSACESTVFGTPVFDCPDLMANIGGDCDDNNEMTVMDEVQADCTCVGVLPTFDCPDLMQNIGDICDDGNANTLNDMIILGADNPDFDANGTIVITAIPEGTDLVFTITSANGCSFEISVPSPTCEPVQVDCPATAKVNEFHYDNEGTDANEFIEVILSAGSDPTLVQIDLINGSTDTSYETYQLTTGDFVSTDGTNDYYVWNPSNLQNGPDGIALSCIDGSLYSFISYEGIITGVGAPVDGVVSTDIGVSEDSNTTETQSIMCDGTGTFLTNCTADPGAANDLSTCMEDVPGCTDPTACNYNENANVDDGSCLLAEGCDECDGMGGITDNPEVGDLCDDGDPATNYDTIQPDCTCLGTMETFDCPDLIANVGDACDDDNPATENDAVTDDCTCSGTTVCLADFMIGDVSCETVTGGTDSYTVNIIFTGGGNDMFTIVPNAGEISGLDCQCEGMVIPPPGDLIISELSFNPCGTQGSDSDCEYFIVTNNGGAQIDLSGYAINNAFTFIFPGGTTIDPGQSISVGITGNCATATFDISGGWSGSMSNSNNETLDIIDAAGMLIGSFTYNGSLGDGNCMAQCFDNTATPSECESTVFAAPVFDCPDLMLNIGADCDDMDVTTGNDVVQADCTCAGLPFDCPTEMASFGDPCDDGDDTTLNDIILADCTCLGTVPPPPGDIIITELSYNPCGAQGADGDCEYIVIQNNGTMDIDLTGWAIGSGTSYAFPVSTIITVGQSISIGTSDNCPVATFDLVGLDGALGNSGETILILDDSGAIVSSYNYNNSIANGDCMAYCFDLTANPFSCESSVYGEPMYDCPGLMAFIGDNCDDNNEMTVMDQVQADCICVGIIPTFDCPDEMVNLGDSCDDGDANTVGDMIILGGDNPDFDNTGTIVVTSIPEGTDLLFTITSTNGCSFDINVPSPLCEPEPTDCEPNSGNFPWNGQ